MQGEEQPRPGERPTWTDWTTMVKQAYENPSRTKAACELVHAGIMCLTQKVRTEKFETFLRILRTRNPNTPQMILGNMASIFAYSGKMTRTQAGGSYTFKVFGSFGFGLVVPTLFRQKSGFRDDSSKVYHLITWYYKPRSFKDPGRRSDSTWRFLDAPRPSLTK